MKDYFGNLVDRLSELKMDIVNMDAIRIWSKEMEQSFYDSFVQELKRIQHDNKGLDGYKIYIILADEVDTPDSRLNHYYRLWKKMKRKNDLDGFVLGSEEQSLALIFRSETIKTSTLLAQV